jgi:hypothetical protein
MTKPPVGKRCRWCGRPFDVTAGPGRPREFCRQTCRQQDYLARQRSAEAGLSDAELIVARSQLDELYDRLYVLEAAIEDVERDLSGEPQLQDYREAIAWLLDAARPLVDLRLDPPIT